MARSRYICLIPLLTASSISTSKISRAETAKAAFPGAEWERVATPEPTGYSGPKLEALRIWLKTQNTTAMMVIVGGRVLFEYGDVKLVSKVASVRKSVLAMMYGKYVADGTIDLHKNIKTLGVDDVQKFLPIEEHATLEHILMARSGVYHPGGEEDPQDDCPKRGSQWPGLFFCYNSWDFNAAGTAFEKLTGKNLFEALESDLARPIGMQDYDRERQKKNSELPRSVHPEYATYLSTRDMARLGLLMLRGGNWNGKQVLPDHWSAYITTLATPANEIFPTSLRLALGTTGPFRWGYGVMWWVWDSIKLPGGTAAGDYHGAYSAMGTGGQSITVLPAYDMVVAHKVELGREPELEVTPLEFSTILQMVMASYCKGGCK